MNFYAQMPVRWDYFDSKDTFAWWAFEPEASETIELGYQEYLSSLIPFHLNMRTELKTFDVETTVKWSESKKTLQINFLYMTARSILARCYADVCTKLRRTVIPDESLHNPTWHFSCYEWNTFSKEQSAVLEQAFLDDKQSTSTIIRVKDLDIQVDFKKMRGKCVTKDCELCLKARGNQMSEWHRLQRTLPESRHWWWWFDDKYKHRWIPVTFQYNMELEANYPPNNYPYRNDSSRYHCFGSGKSASVNYNTMQTKCNSGKCSCYNGYGTAIDHMTFKLKRV